MSIIDDRPTALSRVTRNRNPFIGIQSELVVRRLPDVEFFCQAVSIPGVSMTPVDQHTPLTPIRHAGDVVNFDEFEATFMVDEWLENYSSIFDWIVGLGFPEDSSQYADLSDVSKRLSGEGVASDVSVFLLDSRGRPKMEIVLYDAFPISITSIDVDSRRTDSDPMTCRVKFAYTRYVLRRVNRSGD